MDNRRLLELAAKAAGYDVYGRHHPKDCLNVLKDGSVYLWSPSTWDSDAFRLAVKLKMEIDIVIDGVAVRHSSGIKTLCGYMEFNDECETLRAAITRCAASIGERMQ